MREKAEFLQFHSKKDKVLLYVSLIVVASHLLFSLFFLDNKTEEAIKKTPLVVKTVRLQEKTQGASNLSSASPALAAPVVKKEIPKAVKPKTAEKVSKEVQPKKSEGKEKEVAKQLKQSLNKAKESLEKINVEPRAAPSTPKDSSVAFVSSLNAEAFQENALSSENAVYQDELVFTLRQNLKLPEYGKVDILLTLSSKGEVVLLKIESAKSALNRAYVERELPRLIFAPFKGSFAKNSEFLFHITLTND